MSRQGLLPFGEPLANQDPAGLTIAEARQAVAAVSEHSDFALRELRSISVRGGFVSLIHHMAQFPDENSPFPLHQAQIPS